MRQTIIIITIAMFCFGWSQNMKPSERLISQLPQEIQTLLNQPAVLWKQSQNHPVTESSRDEADLYGEWEHENNNAALWVTSGTDQTIPNPAQAQGIEPSDGAINIDGPIPGSMNYMRAMSGMYGYDILFVILSNNSLEENDDYYYYEEDSIPENIVLPFYMLEYMSYPAYGQAGGEFTIADTVDGEFVEYYFEIGNVDDLIIADSTSLRLNITDLTLTNDNGDSTYVISGTLVPGTIDIEAGVPTEISSPMFEEDFGPVDGNETMFWQLYQDGSGLEIVSGEDYYDSWSDTTELQWSANEDSMTLVYFWYEEDEDEPAYIDTVNSAYGVENDTLSINATMDLCEMMGDDYYYYGGCYEMLNMFLGIEDIQEALMDFDMTMSYVGELDVLENGIVPETTRLYPSYPNPFNPVTTIRFDIPVETHHNTSLQIFDITGRMVETLVNEKLEQGQHIIQWNASQHASGVYFLRMETAIFSKTQKMILLK